LLVREVHTMRDKTHRIANIVVLLLSFAMAAFIYFAIEPLVKNAQSQEIAGTIAFSFGLFLNTSYLIFNFKNLSHKDSKLNSSTQIWFGIMLIAASLILLAMVGFFAVAFDTALIWMSAIVLVMIYVGIDRFDVWLEKSLLKHKA